MRQALRRWWQWETRAFRWGKDGPTPLQVGMLVGIAFMIVSVAISAWSVGAR
jgi:hypothetical protein